MSRLRQQQKTSIASLDQSKMIMNRRKKSSSLVLNTNILKNLKSNEELNKLRVVLNKNESEITVKEYWKNPPKTTRDESNENINLSNNNQILRNRNDNGLYIYTKYDKNKKEELTTIQKKIESIIDKLSEVKENASNECSLLFKLLSSSLITKENDVLLSIRHWLQSSWGLLYFSIIICHDYMNNNQKINTDSQQNIINIKNAFVFHFKIIKIIQMNYPSSSLIQSDVVKFNQSINCLLTSIASTHKTLFSNYPPQKYNEFISIWGKIPHVSLITLEGLYIRIKNNQLTTEDTFAMPQALIQLPLLSKQKDKEYTLVLDLDETLIHYEEDIKISSKGTVSYRPGLIAFLENVCPYYELVLFTMSLKQYADAIVDIIEKDRIFFNKRLYREHSTFHCNLRVKDLTTLGRDLGSTIIIDDIERNFLLQKENGILIKPYYGKDDNDFTLIDLIPILVKIAKEKMDTRFGLKTFKETILNINANANSKQSKKCIQKEKQ